MKDFYFFLRHILDAIEDVKESIGDFSRKEFLENKDVREANIRRIEVIGEAVRNLSEDFKKRYSKVSWREIIGTRDKMIHHYFGVDLDIVWNIIKKDLPELKDNIEEILEKEGD